MADSPKQTMRRRGKESKGGAADQERQPRLRDSTAKMSELYRVRIREGKPSPWGWVGGGRGLRQGEVVWEEPQILRDDGRAGQRVLCNRYLSHFPQVSAI